MRCPQMPAREPGGRQVLPGVWSAVDAHVRGLVQGIERDEPMRPLDRGLDAMVAELVGEERLEDADRHPPEALAFRG
jgi:hypothetical protein